MAGAVDRPHSLDELLWWMERLAARRSLPKWEREFAASMVAQGKRRSWHPTPKQERVMRQMVAAALDPCDVIDTAA